MEQQQQQQPQQQQQQLPPQQMYEADMYHAQGNDSPASTPTNNDALQDNKDDKMSRLPEVLDDYPPPRPPSNRKRNILTLADVKEGDKRARSVELKDVSTLDELISKLTDSLTKDATKVRAIFSWLCTQKIQECSFPGAPADSPKGLMWKIKDGQSSFASTFALMCRHAKIQCAIIHGYAKSASYEIGSKTVENLANSWNAVYIANGWRIIFPLWASRVATGKPSKGPNKLRSDVASSEGTLNEYYFMPDPEEFLNRCFPEISDWQLVRSPITKETFLELPFCRPPFFESNLKIVSKPSCILHSVRGMVDIAIKSIDNEELLMSYELFHLDEVSHMPIESDIELDNYVAVMNHRTKINFKVRFPKVGSYQLDILGGVAGRIPTWLCSFKLVCTETRVNPKPYPVNPDLGFGPCVATEIAGLVPRSHLNGCILHHAKKELDIKFRLLRPLHIHATLHTTGDLHENLHQWVKPKIYGNELNINVGLPHNGEYVLQINSKESFNEPYENVCNYILASEESKQRLRHRSYENGAEKRARMILHEGLQSKDPEEIEKAIEKFQEYNLDDGGELKKAYDKLQYMKISKVLRNAIMRRKTEVLAEALLAVKSSEFSDRLSHLVREAEEVKKLGSRHDILHLTQKTISEIHRYKTPTPAMRDIVKATFLLLGEPSNKLYQWEDMQCLMRQVGQYRFLTRIRTFDAVNVNMEAAKEAAVIIRKYTEDTAKTSSAGVGTFYVWCVSILSHFGLVEPPPAQPESGKKEPTPEKEAAAQKRPKSPTKPQPKQENKKPNGSDDDDDGDDDDY